VTSLWVQLRIVFMQRTPTASTPNIVKSTWGILKGLRANPCAKIILPTVEAAGQEHSRQMQLKMAEVLVAEQKRCLGYGHEHTLHVLRLRGKTETRVLYVRSWAHVASFPCRSTCKYPGRLEAVALQRRYLHN
jgi:hypothetical protein